MPALGYNYTTTHSSCSYTMTHTAAKAAQQHTWQMQPHNNTHGSYNCTTTHIAATATHNNTHSRTRRATKTPTHLCNCDNLSQMASSICRFNTNEINLESICLNNSHYHRSRVDAFDPPRTVHYVCWPSPTHWHDGSNAIL